MASKKRYYRSLEEMQNPGLTEKLAENEFAENLPVEGFLEDKSSLEAGSTSRRDFLKFLGFSTAAVTLAACEAPMVKSVPYVVKPGEVTPGVPTYYATTMYDGYDFANVIVKTREGRPIKIEPNKEARFFGATNARVQGSILSLYDSTRIHGPRINGASTEWANVDSIIAQKLDEVAGRKIAILTPSLPSPSTKRIIEGFKSRYASAEHIIFDAVDHSPALDAAEQVYGQRAIPYIDLEQAELVVGFNADFLNDWAGMNLQPAYSASTKPGPNMMRHIQVESNMSITGSNADDRFPFKPSQVNRVLAEVYAALSGGSASSPEATAIASEIREKGSRAVVLADGSREAHILAYLINSAIGSAAVTGAMTRLKESNINTYKNFLNEAQSGAIGAVFIYDCNPIEHSHYGANFLEALKNIPISVAMVSHDGAVAQSVNVVAPMHHWLESWGDYNPMDGVYTIQQPTIRPVYNTRQFQDCLLRWSGNTVAAAQPATVAAPAMAVSAPNDTLSGRTTTQPAAPTTTGDSQANALGAASTATIADQLEIGDTNSYYNYLKRHWEGNILGGRYSFNQALYNGYNETQVSTGTATTSGGGGAEAVSAFNSVQESGWEIQLYTKVGMGDGRQATNPWMMEFPDPVTRTSWDNYLTMNPLDAEEAGISMWNFGPDRNGRMQFNGPYYNVTVGGQTIKAPVFVQPGQARGSVGLALGYGVRGQIAAANKLESIGVNAYPLYKDGVKSYPVTLESAGGTHPFANIQMMNTLMGRYEIAREASLDDFLNKEVHEWNQPGTMETFKGKHTPLNEVDLWRSFDRTDGPHFKMSIDLNSCTGCGACVIACHAENNVPVVGKDEIRMSRDMAWLRIDRYYSDHMQEVKPDKYPYTQKEALRDTDLNEPQQYDILIKPAAISPDVVFQPMMCQHCNHAPCETVCPVAATSHGKQGQNMMAYNRCVGTRYCANNCPYKVRRFNWFNYAQNSKFDFHMNNDLGRMVLNPDVVVRQRGVMEKCSMCIQRTQATILEAKKEGRRLQDDEVQTACSMACPSGAIVFGDINDDAAEVTQLITDKRKYVVLEDIGTQPNLFYHVKIRNRKEINS